MRAKKVWRPFDEAREFARSLKLRNQTEWHEYLESGERPDDIPSNPNIIYKNDGWNGWINWLGNEDRIREPVSEGTRRKMSESWKNRKPMSEETRIKLSEARKGRTFSEEWKRKMSEAMKGRIHSEETKRKMRESRKGQKPNLGKTHSEETRRKMSESGIVAKSRPEVKRKMSEAMKGRTFSEETKRKMSEVGLVAHNTPEAKEKHSIARAKRKFPLKDSKPEMILQKICKDEGIKFVTQKVIKLNNYESHHVRRHPVDLFIEPNICILADGDWWHANPNPHMANKKIKRGINPDTIIVSSARRGIKKVAKDIVEKDAGITRDLREQGYTVLRFWESDLLFDTEKCRQKIVDAVRNVE